MEDSKVKLNLGCGLCALPDWINIDSSFTARLAKLDWLYRLICKTFKIKQIAWPKNIRSLDVRKKLPFPDCSVKAIFTSHMLEHMSFKDANFVIKECFRVLCPGGIIRIVVPDLYKMTKQYVELVNKSPAEQHSHNYLKELNVFHYDNISWLRKLFGHSKHLYMYDFWSLKSLLETKGFSDIQEMSCKQSRLQENEILEDRGSESIYVEAIKK